MIINLYYPLSKPVSPLFVTTAKLPFFECKLMGRFNFIHRLHRKFYFVMHSGVLIINNLPDATKEYVAFPASCCAHAVR